MLLRSNPPIRSKIVVNITPVDVGVLASAEEYQQQNAKEEESDKEAEQQAEPVAEEKTEDENEAEQAGVNDTQSDVLSQLNQEEQQSLKQWLQRIPDNPGKLLKVKFRNNTLLKQREQTDTEEKYKGNPW